MVTTPEVNSPTELPETKSSDVTYSSFDNSTTQGVSTTERDSGVENTFGSLYDNSINTTTSKPSEIEGDRGVNFNLLWFGVASISSLVLAFIIYLIYGRVTKKNERKSRRRAVFTKEGENNLLPK